MIEIWKNTMNKIGRKGELTIQCDINEIIIRRWVKQKKVRRAD